MAVYIVEGPKRKAPALSPGWVVGEQPEVPEEDVNVSLSVGRRARGGWRVRWLVAFHPRSRSFLAPQRRSRLLVDRIGPQHAAGIHDFPAARVRAGAPLGGREVDPVAVEDGGGVARRERRAPNQSARRGEIGGRAGFCRNAVSVGPAKSVPLFGRSRSSRHAEDEPKQSAHCKHYRLKQVDCAYYLSCWPRARRWPERAAGSGWPVPAKTWSGRAGFRQSCKWCLCGKGCAGESPPATIHSGPRKPREHWEIPRKIAVSLNPTSCALEVANTQIYDSGTHVCNSLNYCLTST